MSRPWPRSAPERHRSAAETFARRVDGVRDWDSPTPVPEWRARDVVRHLLEWFPGFLQHGAGVSLDEMPTADPDLLGSWERRCAEVQALLEGSGDATYSSGAMGEMPLPEAIDRFYTGDVVMHTWDLARATGQDDTLPPDFCRDAVAQMEPLADVLAASGHFGPRVPVPEDADDQTRLLGLIGRDPGWRPRRD